MAGRGWLGSDWSLATDAIPHGGCSARRRLSRADDLVDEEERASLGLFIEPSDVLTLDAQHEELNTTKQGDNNHLAGPAGHRVKECPGHQSIDQEAKGHR